MKGLIKKFDQNKIVYINQMVMSCIKIYRVNKFVDADGKVLDYSKFTGENLRIDQEDAVEGLAEMLQAYVVAGEADDKVYRTIGDFLIDHICISMYHARYNGKRHLTYERYKMVRRKGRQLLHNSPKHKEYFFKIYMIAAKTLGTTICNLEKGVFDEA